MTPTIAERLHRSLRTGTQMPCPTEADPSIDLPAAYRVARAVTALRIKDGERPVGRKIGFTNPRIWGEYNVDAPVWGHVYDCTVQDAAASLDLAGLMEPKIEPEIVFRLGRAPSADMDEVALIGCISHVAHGFEIVQSAYAGWRFRAADSVMGFGMHGALLLGPWSAIAQGTGAAWQRALADFTIRLSCDGAEIDRGQATSILDQGPLAAIAHLVQLLANDDDAPDLAAGEIVTTGTLTRAFPILAGQTWTTEIEGLALDGLRVRFEQGGR